VVNPNDIVNLYGADTLRLYIMFIGDFEKAAPWQDTAVKGSKRFLDRVWNLEQKVQPGDSYSRHNEASIHRTIKKVSEDIEGMKFNTAIAAMMTLVNEFYDKGLDRADYMALLKLMSPFTPHIAEELWEHMGGEGLCCRAPWPVWDEKCMVEAEKTIAVQVGGKLRSTVTIPADASDEEMVKAALADEKIARMLEGMELVRTITVKNKLVNLILKPKTLDKA
jgi:leucyl-tRNA synthetase